MQLKKY